MNAKSFGPNFAEPFAYLVVVAVVVSATWAASCYAHPPTYTHPHTHTYT